VFEERRLAFTSPRAAGDAVGDPFKGRIPAALRGLRVLRLDDYLPKGS